MLLTDNKTNQHHLNWQKQKPFASSWVEIDKQALDHNIRMYKSIIGNAVLAPVIKSNAYGHGIELIARFCDQHDLVDYLCIVSLREALFLRSIGIKKPLLVVSIIDGNLEDIITHNIDVVAYDYDIINELNRIGLALGKKARVHIKVDTGLSRLGLNPQNALLFIHHAATLPFIEISGMFTHFAESESDDQTFTNQQLDQFNELNKKLEEQGICIPFKHTACTAAITANVPSQCNFVRLGIGLYGLWPSSENKELTIQQFQHFSLQPILTWKTKIIQIKELTTGSSISYDRTHQVAAPTRIAILPVGYWDGLDRRLSNKGSVIINNQHAPILGRIAMNLTIVDITNLDVSLAHEVTLLGNYFSITAEALATHCNTINYEVVTRINPLLPRIFGNN